MSTKSRDDGLADEFISELVVVLEREVWLKVIGAIKRGARQAARDAANKAIEEVIAGFGDQCTAHLRLTQWNQQKFLMVAVSIKHQDGRLHLEREIDLLDLVDRMPEMEEARDASTLESRLAIVAQLEAVAARARQRLLGQF